MMTVLTTEGYFLTGTSTQIVGRIAELVAVGAGLRASGDGDVVLHECRRIARYRQSIGPALADMAACNLLKGLAEDGHLLVKP